jgi:hypothetical protein
MSRELQKLLKLDAEQEPVKPKDHTAMQPKLICIVILLLAGIRAIALADFPIRQSAYKEWLPAVAYNETDHEYLVVWSEYIYNGVVWLNWVMGQRIGEEGSPVGSAFVVYPVGVNPIVTYNSSAHEYLVGFNPGGGYVGQRVSTTGTLIGDPTALMNGVSNGRLLYNSITGQYLFVGAVLVETPAGSGYYNIKISSCKIGANGQALTSPVVVANRAHGYQPPEPAFGAAYAPVQSTETPYGRYLLAIGRGVVLYMLNSDGAVINIVSDPSHPGVYYQEVPFKTHTPSGGEFQVDVAYGDQSSYSMTGPAFLVVWADQNNKWNGSSGNGIWGGFLDATKISYLTTDIVQDNAFPISGQADHFSTTDYVESWKPKATYNPASEKFFVVWRETPNTNPLNTTTVNHIRGSYVFEKVPATNVIISATGGAEDPACPALAASTASEHALVVWEDYRNSGSTNVDIYGSIQKVADPVQPPVTDVVVVNTLDDGSGSLRQAILNANANPGKDTITFNIPGAGPHTIMPVTPLPALTDPVVIDGYTQPDSKVNTSALKDPGNARLQIVLDGTAMGSNPATVVGLEIGGGNSCVRGLVISSFTASGILLEDKGGNVIDGNYIGTDNWGLVRRDNSRGIYIDNVAGNLIGGTSAAARNVISGNKIAGVQIVNAGATGNSVQGNYIGVDATGNAPLGNIAVGVDITGASWNLIGGASTGAGNVIGGSGRYISGGPTVGAAIQIIGDATGNLVAGNFIGTNPAGNASVANCERGIVLVSYSNTIGGADPAARNIISGNGLEGLYINGDGNIVQGNYIGTDISGTKAVSNGTGVRIVNAGNNLIGGVIPGAGNLISGSKGSEDLMQKGRGIEITNTRATRNIVQGNWIGTAAGGSGPLGNWGPGVFVDLAGHNSIGGVSEGAGNVIAFNGGDGVVVTEDSAGNRIRRNSIFGNARLGINLAGGVEDSYGVTGNDPGDADTGPNRLQNYPVLSSVMGGDYLDVAGNLNSTPNATLTLEFFSTSPAYVLSGREGRTFLGYIEVTTDAAGNAPFEATIGSPVGIGQSITATATDEDGSTSEFSAPVVVTLVAGTEVVTSTADSGPGTLRQAILNANAKVGRDTIAFNIPGAGPHTIVPASSLPEITDPVVIDGFTQSGSSANTAGLREPCNAVLQIVLDGTVTKAMYLNYDIGLHIHCGNSRVRGLVMQYFGGYAFLLDGAGSNVIEGNFIGTDHTGLDSRGNLLGVFIDSVSYNTIGGIDPEARNVISGNDEDGIYLYGKGADHNLIRGNFIGVDAKGTSLLSNRGYGVGVFDGASNTIGGSVAGAGNLIARMVAGDTTARSCICIGGVRARQNSVSGNLIGTTLTGADPIVCSTFGVAITDGANKNTVGGTNAGARNIISRCSQGSIYITSDSNTVQGNYIGTDFTGTKALSSLNGIMVLGNGNRIGGRTLGTGNLISGQLKSGIWLFNGYTGRDIRDNKIEGNRIGTQADGVSPLGNVWGVRIDGSVYDTAIGDTVSGAGNTIAFNGVGVVLRERLGIDPISNRISGNSLFGNKTLGIDLGGGNEDTLGITENDPGDWDSGPNNLQNSPVITSVEGGSSLTVQGTLNSSANATFTLEFFGTPSSGTLKPGEGQTFLGTTTVRTDAGGNAAFHARIGTPVAAGRAITATATNYLNNTSELSLPVLVTATGVSSNIGIPGEPVLFQNYPNPFNPATTIRYGVPSASHVLITVFNALGQLVATLVNAEQSAGYYQIRFDGAGLASGVYFCRMQCTAYAETRRALLVR